MPLLDEGGLRPPTLRQMADAIGEDPKKLEFLLVNAARRGLVIRISQNRFIRPAASRRLTEIVEETAKASTPGLVTAAAFRDRSGIGRDLSIEVLEFFDRMKFTRRVGDAHHVLHHAADAFNDRAGERVMNPDLAEKNRTPVGRPDFKSGERR